MLPEGINIKDNSLMIIEDINNRKAVGIIWYLYPNLPKKLYTGYFFPKINSLWIFCV